MSEYEFKTDGERLTERLYNRMLDNGASCIAAANLCCIDPMTGEVLPEISVEFYQRLLTFDRDAYEAKYEALVSRLNGICGERIDPNALPIVGIVATSIKNAITLAVHDTANL